MKLTRRIAPFVVVCACAAGAVSCEPSVDLSKSLAVTDVFTGWYDAGIKNGLNYLKPSITFQLQNTGKIAFATVDLTVAFWRDGDDGEWDSALVTGIGRDALAPGAKTAPITVRPTVGYTLGDPRASLFTNTAFKDVTVKIFAKRSGDIVKIGEARVDRRILPHVDAGGRP
jgi:hypothetical protein